MGQGANEFPHRARDDPYPTTRSDRPPPSAQRAPTCMSSPLLLLLSKRDLGCRATMAKRAHSVRIRVNKRQQQSMLTDHWPELRPASLPIFHRSKAPLPPLPRSLPNLGWQRDPSHRLRLDLLNGGPSPFPHFPPGSPPHLRPSPSLPDSCSHLSNSPKADKEWITPPCKPDGLPTAPRIDRDPTHGHAPASPSTVEGFKFLTINTQNAGANSPSLVGIVTMLGQHSPDFLFLAETSIAPI